MSESSVLLMETICDGGGEYHMTTGLFPSFLFLSEIEP